ncbi:EAL domain-containing protein [Myxococcaceae bacterium JPH2]|nr:EAL domain-containing protein [Myxococcaceae bacterium JPH2]
MNPPRSPPVAPAQSWLWRGDEPRIASVFQPIVDLRTGNIVGHEVLSRGEGSSESPLDFFTRARHEGVTFEAEHACWRSALRRIAELPAAHRRAPFFFNVSPEVLADERFADTALEALVQQHGLHPRQFVLEITEQGAFEDTAQLRRLARALATRGFGIALDDFGAGHSGLVTLVHSAPDFIKLDQALVRDIHHHAYLQHLLKSLVAFSTNVGATLIAEGVESWDELAVLLRLGIRHAQGFLLARPAPTPPLPGEEFERRRHGTMRALHHRTSSGEDTVGNLAVRCASAQTPVDDASLATLFQQTPGLDHVVLLEHEQPRGLITRQRFEARSDTHPAPLIAEEDMTVCALMPQALARATSATQDPVVVTDATGAFLGTVTMRQLILRIAELAGRANGTSQ